MKGKTVEYINDIRDLQGVWNSTLKQSNVDSVFLTYEWLFSWLKVYAPDRKQFIICIKENESVIALAPLIILPVRNFGLSLKRLQFIGYGVSDYMDFIIQKDNRECLEIIFSFIEKHRHLWNYCELHNISEESENFLLLDKVLSKRYRFYKIGIENPCPYVKLNKSFDNYIKSRIAGLRYDLKKGENDLIKMGNLTYEKISDQRIALNELSHFFNMAERREQTVNRSTTIINIDNRRRIFKLYIDNDVLWPHLNFFRICLDGKVIAYHFGFEYNKKLFWYKPTFDIDYSKYSLGKLLIKWAMMYAIDKNFSEFDFLVGGEPYKYQWATESRNVYGLFLSNNTLLSRLIYYNFVLLVPSFIKVKSNFKLMIKKLLK